MSKYNDAHVRCYPNRYAVQCASVCLPVLARSVCSGTCTSAFYSGPAVTKRGRFFVRRAGLVRLEQPGTLSRLLSIPRHPHLILALLVIPRLLLTGVCPCQPFRHVCSAGTRAARRVATKRLAMHLARCIPFESALTQSSISFAYFSGCPPFSDTDGSVDGDIVSSPLSHYRAALQVIELSTAGLLDRS